MKKNHKQELKFTDDFYLMFMYLLDNTQNNNLMTFVLWGENFSHNL